MLEQMIVEHVLIQVNNQIIIDTKRLFEILTIYLVDLPAASSGIGTAANVDGDEGVTGWGFTYRQLPGNC